MTPYLPSDAGQALIGRTKFAPQNLQLLHPWLGAGILCAYAAAMAAAMLLLSRRDT